MASGTKVLKDKLAGTDKIDFTQWNWALEEVEPLNALAKHVAEILWNQICDDLFANLEIKDGVPGLVISILEDAYFFVPLRDFEYAQGELFMLGEEEENDPQKHVAALNATMDVLMDWLQRLDQERLKVTGGKDA